MRARKIAAILLASALPAICGGCWALWLGGGVAVGAGAGAAGVAYAEGSLSTHLDQPPPEVAKAVEKAFQALSISKVSTASSPLSAELAGRTATDDKVKVYAETEGTGSKLTIRVGFFGDEAQSLKILEEIKKGLPEQSSNAK